MVEAPHFLPQFACTVKTIVTILNPWTFRCARSRYGCVRLQPECGNELGNGADALLMVTGVSRSGT